MLYDDLVGRDAGWEGGSRGREYVYIHTHTHTHMHTHTYLHTYLWLPRWLSGKNLPAVQETQGMQAQLPGQEDPLEEGMVMHFSILAWIIPWTEELCRLRS